MHDTSFTRRDFLRMTAVAGLAAALPFSGPAMAQQSRRTRPNIILILADDLGYECIGANGGTSYATPNLDRLAASGVRFDYCHSQPLCTPSRVQLMTGMNNKRNYIEFEVLGRKETTFAHLLKKAGYTTCMVGKWQLGKEPDAPQHFGFDEACLWQHTRRPSRYKNPGFEINGKPVDYSSGEYGPDIINDYACEFMQRHQDEPFFLYYSMMLTHDPFQPVPGSPDWDKPLEEGKAANDPKYFPGMVAYMDKLVGRIVETVNELELSENTLILFAGDNGTNKKITSMLNGREVQGGKFETTDTGTHVPLIVSWPDTAPQGQVCSDLIDFSDFLPTLCEAAGASIPSKLPIDGISFLPQIKGQPGSPREAIFAWYVPKNADAAKAKEWARDKRYKLYANGKFYNVEADPLEESPLTLSSLSAEAATAHEKLQNLLDQYKNARPESAKSSRPAKQEE